MNKYIEIKIRRRGGGGGLGWEVGEEKMRQAEVKEVEELIGTDRYKDILSLLFVGWR